MRFLFFKTVVVNVGRLFPRVQYATLKPSYRITMST